MTMALATSQPPAEAQPGGRNTKIDESFSIAGFTWQSGRLPRAAIGARASSKIRFSVATTVSPPVRSVTSTVTDAPGIADPEPMRMLRPSGTTVALGSGVPVGVPVGVLGGVDVEVGVLASVGVRLGVKDGVWV